MREVIPLSKSQYTYGITCRKKLWLYRHRRDLEDPVSQAQEAVFEQGHEVGILAQKLYPTGVLVAEDHTQAEAALEKTKKLIESKAPAIFEAAFQFEDVLIRADILVRNDDGTYDLIEVKSTTKVKTLHIQDAALQTYVLRNSGLSIGRTFLMCLNSDYTRGEKLDLRLLFKLEDLTSEVAELETLIPDELAELRAMIARKDAPEVALGSHCKKPYACAFKGHCWKDLPPDSIHYLGGIRKKLRAELLGLGVETIPGIPDDVPISQAQRIEKQSWSASPVINQARVQEHLSRLKWPLYYFDFETVSYAIPPYQGTRSYEALTFQYSLHVQQEQGGALVPYDFLFEKQEDPRRACAEQMLLELGDVGSIIAYSAEFEKSKIKEMAELFPNLSVELGALLPRFWDLEVPFRNRWYWDAKFRGSSSIKSVLPVLVPGMSYEGLVIQKGDQAQIEYRRWIEMKHGSAEWTELRNALLTYCRQDSLAMAKILEVLYQNSLSKKTVT